MSVGSQHLRTAGLLAIAIGAAGSVCFLMLAAEHPPAFLLMLFVLWVVSPFALLAIAERLSTTWAFATRATLRTVMLAVACASLALYGGVVLMQIKAKTPFFVLVPPLSWLLTVAAVSGASLIRRMRGE